MDIQKELLFRTAAQKRKKRKKQKIKKKEGKRFGAFVYLRRFCPISRCARKYREKVGEEEEEEELEEEEEEEESIPWNS